MLSPAPPAWRWTVSAPLLVGLLLVLALLVGATTRASAPATPADRNVGLLPGGRGASDSAVNIRQMALLLDRSEVTLVEANRLLALRDANPTLIADQSWLSEHARAVADLQAEYDRAVALTASSASMPLQRCLTEGLRLTATGQALLHDGFLRDGHGAYYDGAHGNWDLNLGTDALRHCRALLVARQAGP